MIVKVIDASAFGAILFNEPDARNIAARLRNCNLAAPALLPFEIASVCLKKIRMYPDKRELLLTAWRMADRVKISYSSVEMTDVISLAEKTKLSVYDASYLWLARKLGAELITLDKELEKKF